MTHRTTSTAQNANLLHSSTRTCMSTNADPAGGSARVTFRVTKMEMRWLEGDVAIRFTDSAIDVTPRVRPAARVRVQR
jgi:hypothetical protein